MQEQSRKLRASFDDRALIFRGRDDRATVYRAMEVARQLVTAGVWDGKTRIEFDALTLYDRLCGDDPIRPAALVAGQDYRLYTLPPLHLALLPAWRPNRLDQRTSNLFGDVRRSLDWTDPRTGDTIARCRQSIDGVSLELSHRGRVASVFAPTVRAAYRAAHREQRLARYDPARLRRQRDRFGEAVADLRTENRDLRRRLDAQRGTIERQRVEQEKLCTRSNAVIHRLARKLDEARRDRAAFNRQAAQFVVFEHTPDAIADAQHTIGEMLADGWRIEHMSTSGAQTAVLLTNARAIFSRPQPTSPPDKSRASRTTTIAPAPAVQELDERSLS